MSLQYRRKHFFSFLPEYHSALSRLTISAFTLIVLLFSIPADAQETEDDEVEIADEVDWDALNELEPVVVTGERQRKKKSESTVEVKSVSRKTMEAKGDTSLYQALRNVTGVTPETNCQNCNFDGVRLNGLDSKYNQILIDGIPLVSPLAEVYFYQSFPESLIDRIEIVKGGGSALYGGGAIGGVINIIPRAPRSDFSEITIQENLTEKASSETYLGFASARHSKSSERDEDNVPLSLMAFGSLTYGTPYDRNDDGYSEISRKRASSLGLSGSRGAISEGKLTATLLYNEDDRRGGDHFERADHQAAVREGTQSRNTTGIVRYEKKLLEPLTAEVYQAVSYMERRSYFGGAGEDYSDDFSYDGDDDWTSYDLEGAVSGYGATENPLSVSGFNFTQVFNSRFALLTGGMFTYEAIDDRRNGVASRTELDYYDAGLYVQTDIKPVSWWNLVTGVRADKHSEIDDLILSPRASSRIGFGEHAYWRQSYSSGFSAPRSYVEDFHLGVIDGASHILKNDPDLKPEYSHSFMSDLTFDFDAAGIHWEPRVGAFYTVIQNAFTIQADTSNVNIRKNSDGLSVKGAEADLNMRRGDLTVTLGGSVQDAVYNHAQEIYNDGAGTVIMEKQVLKAPKVTGNALFIYVMDRFTFSTDLVVYGPMKVFLEDPSSTPGKDEPGSYETPTMLEWSSKVAWSFHRERTSDYQVFVGIKNILDSYQEDLGEGASRDPAYVYGPAQPRTYYFGAKIKM